MIKLLAPTLLLLLGGAAAAQENKDDFGKKIDVRLFNRPLELVVETGGRTAACDVLLFSPDGKQLLATGDDKVVRVWPFDPKTGLNQDNTVSLRWASYLQQRGSIYTVATDFTPGKERVAVAGFGLRTAAVALIDLSEKKSGTVLAGITPDNCPTWTKAQPDRPKEQFDRTVWSLALSPDGTEIAIGMEHGRVFLWKPGQKDSLRPLGNVPDHKPGEFNPVRHLRYTDATTVLGVAYNGHVCKWDTSRGDEVAPTRIFRFSGTTLRNVAYDPVHKRFAAFAGVSQEHKVPVELVNLDGSGARQLDLPADQFPQCLAFDVRGERLAVGYTIQPQTMPFHKLTGGGVRVFDLTERDPKGSEGPRNSYYPEALAFHPKDSTLLAVAGGKDHEVVVYNLDSKQALTSVVSTGNCLWGVAFSADEEFRYIGYKTDRVTDPKHPNARGAGDWRVFDRLNLRFAPAKDTANFTPCEPLASLGGWQVITDPSGYTKKDEEPTPFKWKIKDPDGKEFFLPLIEEEDRHPRCYTFVKGNPPKLVVGHYWGMTVYELNTGEAPKVVRKFVGHQGEVISVAPSANGKFLLTCSRDQTIACWSLKPFPAHSTLGASFKVDGNALLVDKVDPGSPAWEAGLSANDEVIKVGTNKWLDKKDFEAALTKPAPGRPILITVRRAGKEIGTSTSLKQRPLWVFFPQQDNQWALWRYYGYKYACSTNGDAAIGWQLSRDVDGTPRFDRAEQYRKKFYAPDDLWVYMRDPEQVTERLNVLDLAAPDARITPETTTVRNDDLKVLFTAKAVGELPAHQVKTVEVWINDHHRYTHELRVPADGFNDEITIPRALLRQGENVVTLHAFNTVEMRCDQSIRIKVLGPPSRPNLYVLSVGINKYKDNKNLADLNAVKDAEGVAAIFKAQQGKLFEKVENVSVLVNENATRANILQAITDVGKAKGLKADDVFLVFLAGHGTSDSDLASDIPEKRGFRNLVMKEQLDRDTFIFCTHDIDLTRPRTTGVAGRDLYLALRRLPCRKVIMLDTCRSGTVGRDPIRALTPSGVGPVILSACLPNQVAAEDIELGKAWAKGDATGLFSIALVRVLSRPRDFDKADGILGPERKDGTLDAEKLGRYLEREVPSLLTESITGKTSTKVSEQQTPAIFVPPLERRLGLAKKDSE